MTFVDTVGSAPVLVHLRPGVEMGNEQFFEFCQINKNLRLE
jgi:hypothetical protein